MKFEASTLSVLKNFAAINSSLLFREGSVLKTISPSKTVAAKANLKQEIPQEFAIFDLSRFLSVLSLFDDPDVDFQDTYCTIKTKAGGAVKYVYADEEVVNRKASDKEIKVPTEYVKFTLKADDFQALMKAMGVLGVPEIAVVGNGKKLALQALDAAEKTRDVFNLVVGDTKQKFRAVIKADNLKIVPQDYNVTISEKGLSHFASVDGSVEYWIAIDATNSKFE